MGEALRIADQLRRAHAGEAWHGPPLTTLLGGVDAGTAAARPIRGAHSIWELVLHISGWEEFALRRVRGEAFEPSEAEDWPAVDSVDETAWRATVERLAETGKRLGEAIDELAEADLAAPCPGQDYSVYALLHGVVQHNLYHAGQIALLRRAAASR